MLKRKITEKLLEWKTKNRNSVLLLKGARQVGKTFILNDFAKKHYKEYIYINFELSKDYKMIFDGNLDYDSLITRLKISFPNIKEFNKNTLLFLDEIQSCPNARTALKTFAIENKLDVVASGSLLGLYYKDVSSFPVGYEEILTLHPLDFEEFLYANNIDSQIVESLRSNYKNISPVDDYIIYKINKLWINYLLVGGMPLCVNKFIEHNDINEILSIQHSLIEDYKNDILKYAPVTEKSKILKTFDSIAIQLSKNNKKFVWSDVDASDSHSVKRKYSSSLEWLYNAGIINFCYNLNEIASPLIGNVRQDCFKVYMKDSGLLLSQYEKGERLAVYNEDPYINKGAIIENVCAEEISTRYQEIYYFEKKSKLEIDFVLNTDGNIAAVEVKSGNNKQSKSLLSIIKNYPNVKRYIKFENNTNVYVDENKIEHYPLFMMMFL